MSFKKHYGMLLSNVCLSSGLASNKNWNSLLGSKLYLSNCEIVAEGIGHHCLCVWGCLCGFLLGFVCKVVSVRL